MEENNIFRETTPVSKQDWLNLIAKDLKGADFTEKLVSEKEGIRVQPLYTRGDLPTFISGDDAELEEDIDPSLMEAISGEDAHALYWNVCEETIIGEGDNLEDLVIDAINRGAHHLRIRVTQPELWDQVMDGINRMQFPVVFDLHVEDDLLHDNIVSIWRNRIGAAGDRDRLIHSIEFDPVGYWLQHGIPEEKGKAFTHLSELFFRLSGHLQDCRLIKVDAVAFAEKGDTIVEQLAKTLALTSDYFDQMSKRNVPLDELIHLLQFRFATGTDYFFEIAKLRAFKLLWANLVKAFIPYMDMIPNPDIQCVTYVKEIPEVRHANLLRTTTAAMSAVLGGCDSLIVQDYDPEDTQAKRLATNIQNILRFECHLDNYRDAANGSFYLENLTGEIAEHAWKRFQEIEKAGGFLKVFF